MSPQNTISQLKRYAKLTVQLVKGGLHKEDSDMPLPDLSLLVKRGANILDLAMEPECSDIATELRQVLAGAPVLPGTQVKTWEVPTSWEHSNSLAIDQQVRVNFFAPGLGDQDCLGKIIYIQRHRYSLKLWIAILDKGDRCDART